MAEEKDRSHQKEGSVTATEPPHSVEYDLAFGRLERAVQIGASQSVQPFQAEAILKRIRELEELTTELGESFVRASNMIRDIQAESSYRMGIIYNLTAVIRRALDVLRPESVTGEDAEERRRLIVQAYLKSALESEGK